MIAAAIFFIFGLLFGSFTNVLVHRFYTGEKILLDRSRCPKCRHIIRWYDNIPLLSFVILGGQCRNCRKKISWQYPIVELITALLFAFIGAKFYNPDDIYSFLVILYLGGLTVFLITILVYDYIHMEIPSLALWGGVVWAVLFSLAFHWFYPVGLNSFYNPGLLSGFWAAIGGFVVFYALVLFSQEKWMGLGDAYLMIFLGLILGWPRIVMALLLAFSSGAVYGIILIAAKKKTLKTQVPFAPFLISAALITIFFYEIIFDWYLNRFIFI